MSRVGAWPESAALVSNPVGGVPLMMMARVFAALVLVLVASRAEGQTSSELPAFEVISIKPRTPDAPPGNIPNSPDRFVRPNVTVSGLIEYAYEARAFQIIGGSAWVRSDRYEVSAKAETAVSQAQMRLMVQRLLAERFGLQVHRETREMDTYALVTARRDGQLGEKMKSSERDCAPIIDAGNVRPRQGDGPPPCAWFVALINGFARLRLTGIPVARFAGVLEPMTSRKIVDRTNLTGTYDIEMDFLPDPKLLGLSIPNSNALQQSDIPALTTAIQDQLGLKLESERAPVDVILIDGVKPPTAN
ncbi:MAG TPA: TIGR03435 family protein [Vicinamibacterales bacterium]